MVPARRWGFFLGPAPHTRVSNHSYPRYSACRPATASYNRVLRLRVTKTAVEYEQLARDLCTVPFPEVFCESLSTHSFVRPGAYDHDFRQGRQLLEAKNDPTY